MERSISCRNTQYAQVNGISIAYQIIGQPNLTTLMLISGLGSQLISWSDDFCALLVENGFRVIRFDNRDAGLSSKFSDLKTPLLLPLIWAYLRNRPLDVPYTLEDMVNDASGLLDALEIDCAHILGGSLGGMIAQMFAVQHASQVKSLTILSSTAYDARVAPMQPKALIQLQNPPQDRVGYIKHAVKVRKAMRGKGFHLDEKTIQQHAALRYDRNHETSGTFRQ